MAAQPDADREDIRATITRLAVREADNLRKRRARLRGREAMSTKSTRKGSGGGCEFVV